MAWIEQIEHADAQGELREIYDGLVERRGKLAEVLKAQGLNPGALSAHRDLYLELMFQASGLSRAEREAIAVVVSAANNCGYCVDHHAEALARYDRENRHLQELVEGMRFLDGEDRTCRILSHALKLTTSPAQVEESDIEALREVGLSDADVLDLSLVTAYFNFVNRIALGLGVRATAEAIQEHGSE